ncbi:XRE family transcriptional regulator [Selenomonas sp. oral taxon 126]|uniref:XRE family transcriptional regulator n=1 Tax=Selenomonas sp. oral taxon 126 TaxID=712528 RepID=UPI00080772C3|nr:XRE family transcriptional regulator [Selenomonas sp. oral taxon 126]ANR69602.1 XRE family transcriptional regulator [Selenomonas sp. oral taxon 126]
MTTWLEFLEEQLKDPEFKREYDTLEDWYQEELAQQRALNHDNKGSASPASDHDASRIAYA